MISLLFLLYRYFLPLVTLLFIDGLIILKKKQSELKYSLNSRASSAILTKKPKVKIIQRNVMTHL